MHQLIEHLEAELADLEAKGLRRRLEQPSGIDLSSNDYLGLSSHPELARRLAEALARMAREGEAPGAPGSRLLRGNRPRHGRLEQRLARYKGCEAALLFPSGYQANVGMLSALIGPRDRAISDEANHASIIDGMRLSRCHKVIVPHLDAEAVERALAEPFPGGRTFLVTESLYSMDGDIAPLADYASLCEEHGAALVIDDAHATGLYGERGSGLAEHFGVEHRAVAITSTFGKALGLGGAFVAGPRPVIDYLVNRCRSFVFSTAQPPLALVGLESALDLAEAEPERRSRVLDLATGLRTLLRERGLDCRGEGGPIVPVVLGEVERALEVARRLRAQGFDVRAIRPPTVPDGTARLRLSVHADHRRNDLERLAEALGEAITEIETVGETGERHARPRRPQEVSA